jgi:hypothetical protein
MAYTPSHPVRDHHLEVLEVISVYDHPPPTQNTYCPLVAEIFNMTTSRYPTKTDRPVSAGKIPVGASVIAHNAYRGQEWLEGRSSPFDWLVFMVGMCRGQTLTFCLQ